MEILKNLIVEEIKRKEKITFCEFMQIALYHPEYGYYMSNTERTGIRGDYYTSPTAHSIFGELIAKQLEEMWRIMGRSPFTLVEVGANNGWLCHDIIRCIKKEYPAFYDYFHYIIVETNPYAREKQRLLLESIDSNNEKVSWHTYTKGGFSFNRIHGCFISNEFVDAMPVHRLKVKKGILKEIYIGYNASGFYEIEDKVSCVELKNYLESNRIHLKENHAYEVNLEAGKWLKHVSEKLIKGFVITIDYGDTADVLYRRNDNEGNLRCYYKHAVNRDYYKRPGEQDITAHVDFTSLMNAGRLSGLEVTGFTRQSHYLVALGILERLNNSGSDVETILKAKNLFHPEAMGEAFKVLIQHKHINNPSLNGLRPLSSIAI